MKIGVGSRTITTYLLLVSFAEAFVHQPASLARPFGLRAKFDEFDAFLSENADSGKMGRRTRRVFLPSTETEKGSTMLTSSIAGSPEDVEGLFDGDYESVDDEAAEALEYEETEMDPMLQKLIEYDGGKSSFSSWLSEADFSEIALTFIIPGLFSLAALQWGAKKLLTRLDLQKDTSLDSFANEMIFHDGDYEEMRMCKNAYSRRLLLLGPLKNKMMLNRYLESYAKKKTVSPQAIR